MTTGSYAPNFAPATSAGWFPLAFNANQDLFSSSSDPVHYKATSTVDQPTPGSHCSAFFTAFPTPGKTYRFEADVNIITLPRVGPAAWFVLADADGNGLGEYASPFATHTGPQHVSLELAMPPDVFSMRVVYGNGGPTTDGRANLMWAPEVLEFELYAASAVLAQDNLLLTPPGDYFDGTDDGAMWDAAPHYSISLERYPPALKTRARVDRDKAALFLEAARS